jgi:sigma-E factor negative regulatory protein RseC
MEKEAVVTAIEGTLAVIQVSVSGQGCGRCQEPGGCRGSVLTQAFGPVCRSFRVPNTIQARVGDWVVVRVGEFDMLRAALMVYLLPVVALVIGAFLGVALAPASGDRAALAGGGLGLAAAVGAIAWLHRRERRRGRLQPYLVRRI